MSESTYVYVDEESTGQGGTRLDEKKVKKRVQERESKKIEMIKKKRDGR